MRNILTSGRKAILGLAVSLLALGAFGAGELSAQTPEGTVIQNTATVTFTDANGNTYSPVDGVVSITVGFSSGISVTRSDAAVTPASPSSDNVISFTTKNLGNGVDTVQASVNVTGDTGVMTNISYKIGTNTYATLSALNTALAALELASNDEVLVDVVYDVPSGQGGLTANFAFTATSIRDGATSDSDNTDVSPPLSGSVDVTTTSSTIDRLPSNGTQYSVTFTVDNQQSGEDTFDLESTVPGTVLSVISVNGDAGSTSTVTIAGSTSTDITVVYTVADVAAGSTEQMTFTATSQSNAATTASATHDVTVIRPDLSMTKQAYRSDKSTAIGAGDRVVPGETVWYKITVSNDGTADAADVSVEDDIPTALTYTGNDGDGGSPTWSISESGGTVTATLSSPLAPSASRFFWISVTVN